MSPSDPSSPPAASDLSPSPWNGVRGSLPGGYAVTEIQPGVLEFRSRFDGVSFNYAILFLLLSIVPGFFGAMAIRDGVSKYGIVFGMSVALFSASAGAGLLRMVRFVLGRLVRLDRSARKIEIECPIGKVRRRIPFEGIDRIETTPPAGLRYHAGLRLVLWGGRREWLIESGPRELARAALDDWGCRLAAWIGKPMGASGQVAGVPRGLAGDLARTPSAFPVQVVVPGRLTEFRRPRRLRTLLYLLLPLLAGIGFGFFILSAVLAGDPDGLIVASWWLLGTLWPLGAALGCSRDAIYRLDQERRCLEIEDPVGEVIDTVGFDEIGERLLPLLEERAAAAFLEARVAADRPAFRTIASALPSSHEVREATAADTIEIRERFDLEDLLSVILMLAVACVTAGPAAYWIHRDGLGTANNIINYLGLCLVGGLCGYLAVAVLIACGRGHVHRIRRDARTIEGGSPGRPPNLSIRFDAVRDVQIRVVRKWGLWCAMLMVVYDAREGWELPLLRTRLTPSRSRALQGVRALWPCRHTLAAWVGCDATSAPSSPTERSPWA